ncbi:hypothetical protein SDC9_21106 [bioreactor metagenome]|uniref:Uncharacterized protein n=1 Tax=bioreactor metagenome TaxID=1076179 RepID=A0A644U900_9ZZZZ|nr:AHH domain-containing protein [Desulfitobacterium hafniense]MEA5023430.1 AHH domain-containing protein [Desulfitobacterium hafniense]
MGFVVEVGSLGSLAGSAGCGIIAGVATKAAIKSEGFLHASKNAASTATNHSLKLKNNLLKGQSDPGPNHAAHHIVAHGAKKLEAVLSRAILKKYNIDIDAAENGVFLPTVRGAGSAAYHPGLHTNRYYENVYSLLKGAKDRNDAIRILNDIRQQLLNGTFPY